MDIFIIFSILFYFSSCKIGNFYDPEKLEYYTNYTLIPPSSTQKKIYILEPHFEVGTLEFIIFFSDSSVSCTFSFYDGDNLIDSHYDFYQRSMTFELKVPEVHPPIITLVVTNPNHNFPYYLYFFNRNYVINLDINSHYLYQISLKNLSIKFKINELWEKINMKLEAKIQYPQLYDNLKIEINQKEIQHYFNKTSSFSVELKKETYYEMELIPNLKSEFTNQTFFFIIFTKNNNFPILFYDYSIYNYNTILSKNKWHFIDSINLIDKYNKYEFKFLEGYQKKEEIKIYIRIKKYNTYDIEYIKKHIPSEAAEYDEFFILENETELTFKTCEQCDQKTILIYIDLNYDNPKSSLYTYSFQKKTDSKELEFKKYLINLYTNYEFQPTPIKNKNIIFISTNHSNTIFPLVSEKYKKFDSFNNGTLYVSYLPDELNKNEIKIKYSDESIQKDDNDRGEIEVYKPDSEMTTFEVIELNDQTDNRIFFLEVRKNYEKYYYIKISNNNNYYIFYEEEDSYSFMKINEMPIYIVDFCNNKTYDAITLMSYKKEYIFKIGYSRPNFNLLNMYILKAENIFKFDLEEGQMKIISFLKTQTEIKLEINLIQKKISNATYINLKIPSKKIENILYISYGKYQNLTLSNTGINLYNENQDEKMVITITNKDAIDKDIPIFIRLAISQENIKLITKNTSSYNFNYGEIGFIKYPQDKTIKMKLVPDVIGTSFNYYNNYLSDNFINNNNIINSPEFYNLKKLDSKEYYFELKTELDTEKLSRNVKSDLYLIFCFDSKVEIILVGEKEDSNNEEEDSSFNILITCCSIAAAIILDIIILVCSKKRIFSCINRNKKKRTTSETPDNEEEYEKTDVKTPQENGNESTPYKSHNEKGRNNKMDNNQSTDEACMLSIAYEVDSKYEDDKSVEQPAPLPNVF